MILLLLWLLTGAIGEYMKTRLGRRPGLRAALLGPLNLLLATVQTGIASLTKRFSSQKDQAQATTQKKSETARKEPVSDKEIEAKVTPSPEKQLAEELASITGGQSYTAANLPKTVDFNAVGDELASALPGEMQTILASEGRSVKGLSMQVGKDSLLMRFDGQPIMTMKQEKEGLRVRTYSIDCSQGMSPDLARKAAGIIAQARALTEASDLEAFLSQTVHSVTAADNMSLLMDKVAAVMKAKDEMEMERGLAGEQELKEFALKGDLDISAILRERDTHLTRKEAAAMERLDGKVKAFVLTPDEKKGEVILSYGSQVVASLEKGEAGWNLTCVPPDPDLKGDVKPILSVQESLGKAVANGDGVNEIAAKLDGVFSAGENLDEVKRALLPKVREDNNRRITRQQAQKLDSNKEQTTTEKMKKAAKKAGKMAVKMV